MASYHYSTRFCSPNPTNSLRDANSFTLTLVSAENLPYIQRLSGRKMKVYAEVSLDGAAAAAMRSVVDSAGETNPTWNFDVHFPITESTCKTGGNLVVNLYCKRSLRRVCIGEVKMNVRNLFDKWVERERGTTERVVGDTHNNGRLKIEYDFGIRG